jgi:hypothetical protein
MTLVSLFLKKGLLTEELWDLMQPKVVYGEMMIVLLSNDVISNYGLVVFHMSLTLPARR